MTAQTFTILYSFSATNDNGALPQSALILTGKTLYGTTEFGGTNGNGGIFPINTDGTSFKNVYSFSRGFGSFPYVTNIDGAFPVFGLLSSGNTLHGTADLGATNAYVTVFALNIDGTGCKKLYSIGPSFKPYYTNNDGDGPNGTLVLSSNILYGTTEFGGSSGVGTIFAINTNGTGFTNPHIFVNADGNYTSYLCGALTFSGSTLYGPSDSGHTIFPTFFASPPHTPYF